MFKSKLFRLALCFAILLATVTMPGKAALAATYPVALGVHYWPQGYSSNALYNVNWGTSDANKGPARIQAEKDIDHLASLGVSVVRLMLWGEVSGWVLSDQRGGKSTFTAQFDEVKKNLPVLLGIFRAHGIKVVIDFGNSYLKSNTNSADHYPNELFWQHAYVTPSNTLSTAFDEFKADALKWINGIVNTIRDTGYSDLILYYDYEDEVTNSWSQTPVYGYSGNSYADKIWEYMIYMNNNSAVPDGKRGLSILYADTDAAVLKNKLVGNRPLDYVIFNVIEPVNQDIPSAYNTVKSLFPSAQVIIGSLGKTAPSFAEEPNQLNYFASKLSSAANTGVPMLLYWMFPDNTPPIGTAPNYGWFYSPNRPKDILGWVAANYSQTPNADFESHTTVPTSWSAGWETVPNVSPVFSTEGGNLPSGEPDAATGSFYGRVTVNVSGPITGTPGVWMCSPDIPATGNQRVYANAYIRSHMPQTRIEIHELNSSGVRTIDANAPWLTDVRSDEWVWKNYINSVGPYSLKLKPDTVKIFVCIIGRMGVNAIDTWRNPRVEYLDVDAVSVSIRNSIMPPCYSLNLGINPSGTGNIIANPAPNCSANTYNQGTLVTLQAAANTSYIFNSWSGNVNGASNPAAVRMDGNRSVTANFSLKPTQTPSPTHTKTATVTRTPTVGASPTKTPTFVSTVLTINSIAAQDGWVLESSENSNIGGTLDSAATTFRLGDDAAKKQYRSILSFNTSNIPDNAVITNVTLKVRKNTVVGGGDPVSIFQGFVADVKSGFFTTSPLQTSDFQTAGNKTIGPTSPALIDNWYSLNLNNAKTFINKLSTNGGLTQIRLRFNLDDNNNNTANSLTLFSGNAGVVNRPQLVITYTTP